MYITKDLLRSISNYIKSLKHVQIPKDLYPMGYDVWSEDLTELTLNKSHILHKLEDWYETCKREFDVVEGGIQQIVFQKPSMNREDESESIEDED